MLSYRLLLTLAIPVLALRLLRDGRLAVERLGGRGPKGPWDHPVIWLHAASNGELTSARALIGDILSRLPAARMIVTCNTATGRALAAGWGLDRVEVRLAPLDCRYVLCRFLSLWQPAALILIENELWPNRLAEMARRGRPVLVFGARMSKTSAARWQRLGAVRRSVMAAISFLSAQDAESAARFAALGVVPERRGPVIDLKAAVAAKPGFGIEDLRHLTPLFPRETTVLAASTHEGEEERVLRAFAAAHETRPDLRLILAPRHPRRSPEIRLLIEKTGLPFATRSSGEMPSPETAIYLADTMGEMALWYALAGLTFVGGSLVERGGHTPYEPAAQSSTLLHGPHVANFADIYRDLDAAGAARRITTEDELCDALLELDARQQAHMTGRAAHVIAQRQADGAGLDPLLEALARLIDHPALAAPVPQKET